MFQKVFGVFAALLVSSAAAPAATAPEVVPLDQRMASARAKLNEVERLAAERGSPVSNQDSRERVQVAQHRDSWRDFHNFRNHHHHN